MEKDIYVLTLYSGWTLSLAADIVMILGDGRFGFFEQLHDDTCPLLRRFYTHSRKSGMNIANSLHQHSRSVITSRHFARIDPHPTKRSKPAISPLNCVGIEGGFFNEVADSFIHVDHLRVETILSQRGCAL